MIAGSSPDILYVTNEDGPRRSLMDVFNAAGLLINITDSREDALSLLTNKPLSAIVFHADEAAAMLNAEKDSARIKRQMDAVYEIAMLVERTDLDLSQRLERVPSLLQHGLNDPEQTQVQIIFEGQTFSTGETPEPGNRISTVIRREHERIGEIRAAHADATYVFDDSEHRLLEMTAHTLHCAIKRATMAEEIEAIQQSDVAALRKDNERLRILHRIDSAILARRSTVEIAELTIHNLYDVVDFQRASLTMFDFEAGEAIATVTDDPATTGMRFPLQRVTTLLDKLRDRIPHIEPDLYEVESPSPAEEVWIKRGVRSYTLFPLVVNGELIGSLNLGRLQSGVLPENTLQLVSEIAGQLAIALYHTWQHEQDMQRVAELEAQRQTLNRQIDTSSSELYAANERLKREISVREQAEAAEHQQRILAESLRDIATALNSSLDFNDVLDQVLASIGRVLPFDAINIMLVEDKGMVRMSRARGYTEHTPDDADLQDVFPLQDRDYLKIMYQTRLPLIISDTQDSDFWSSRPEQAWIRSYIGAPIITDDTVIGFINVKSVAPSYYQDKHLERLKMFTDQAAIAFRNARDHEKAIQYAMLEDRQRLARDLHDAVSQTLFSATMVAGTTLHGWARSPESIQPKLEQLNRLIRGALAEMRTLLLELRPQALQETPLNDLVRQLAEAYSGRNLGTIGIEITGDADLPPQIKTEMYRILQEALNNVSKHARADHVRVALLYTSDGVTITITDDGRGFAPDAIDPSALGLNIMRERARNIGGQLDIESQPKRGTTITLRWKKEVKKN